MLRLHSTFEVIQKLSSYAAKIVQLLEGQRLPMEAQSSDPITSSNTCYVFLPKRTVSGKTLHKTQCIKPNKTFSVHILITFVLCFCCRCSRFRSQSSRWQQWVSTAIRYCQFIIYALYMCWLMSLWTPSLHSKFFLLCVICITVDSDFVGIAVVGTLAVGIVGVGIAACTHRFLGYRSLREFNEFCMPMSETLMVEWVALLSLYLFLSMKYPGTAILMTL